MNAYYKGQPVFGPRGPAGPDGNPIGTIISYMGLTAPQDYLACDGTAYHIADYPELAAFFKEQFGSVNHFGGDGETTFAVPDLRNLFLCGYCGEAEEPLSGEVGERQEATSFPALFIIKAVESVPAENTYSMEETRIGTWIDGKPLYRRIIKFTIPGALNTVVPLPDGISIAEVVHFYGTIFSGNHFFDLQTSSTQNIYMTQIDIALNEINIYTGPGHFVNAPVTLILEYTKTTD